MGKISPDLLGASGTRYRRFLGPSLPPTDAGSRSASRAHSLTTGVIATSSNRAGNTATTCRTGSTSRSGRTPTS